MDFNLNNTSETSSGNLRFSGISSGIDSQNVINSIIEAKRIPATGIEDKISLNTEKVAVFDELQGLTAEFASQLDILRGGTSFFSKDVFENKLAFTDTRSSIAAPAGHEPSSAGSIVGVAVGENAIAGVHTVEVRQLAKAQQIRGDAISSTSDTLDSQGFSAGDFEINGKEISLSATDTIYDLRDKLNAANSGSTPSGVSASVVSVSETEHYIVLSSDDTGLSNEINFTGDQSIHNNLGFTSAGTDTVKTELQAAQNAIIRVDNLGVDVVRESNTIDDVFGDVTIDLFKVELNTEVVIEVEHDLNAVKTSVVGFLNAYNELKTFIEDQQTASVRGDGTEAEFGVLGFDASLRQIESRLNGIVSSTIPGLPDGFQSLGQIGIAIEPDFTLSLDEAKFDKALLQNLDEVKNIFAFNYTSSDSRLSVVSAGANATYTVDGSNVVEPYYINIAGTDVDGKLTDANISTTAGSGNAGLGNNTATIAGQTLTAQDTTGANGMVFFFNGAAGLGLVEDIEVSFTRGVADRLFNFFDDFSKTGGEIDELKTNILNQNVGFTEDIAKIDLRLDLQRTNLEARFNAMEVAMLQLNNLKESLASQISAMTAER